MKKETAYKVLAKIRWQIHIQEMFLMKAGRIQSLKPKDREMIIKDVCWVDGTLAGQVQYVQRRREKLIKAYERIMKKHIRQ